jgi:pimeloyl-ACP methyl ester carboxylesterase
MSSIAGTHLPYSQPLPHARIAPTMQIGAERDSGGMPAAMGGRATTVTMSSRQRRAPRWAGPLASRHATTIRGTRIDWVQAGAGPPLVLLHGYGGSARWWARNLAPLARSHTVYALDLPGFGASRLSGSYSFSRVTELLASWMEANGITPAVVVGHSMGGQLAMLLAASHPAKVCALVLIAPAGIPFDTHLVGIARQAFRSRAGGDARFTPIVVLGSLRAGPRIMWQAVGEIRSVDVRPVLAAVLAPSLILWGDQDRLLPVRNAAPLAAAIKGAELRVVPGAGHNLFFDDPGLVNTAIGEFLAKYEAPIAPS